MRLFSRLPNRKITIVQNMSGSSEQHPLVEGKGYTSARDCPHEQFLSSKPLIDKIHLSDSGMAPIETISLSLSVRVMVYMCGIWK